MTTAIEENARIEEQAAEGIRALLDWAVSVRLEDIPAPVLRKAVLVTADNIAAMVAARDEPQVKAVQAQLARESGRAEALVYNGDRTRIGRIQAALANGIAGSWCELDEGYRMAPCHAGLYTLPALLADAEVEDLEAGAFLRAVVLSYEVTARIARCWIFPTLTLHPHPQSAAIGGAVASGLARAFDAKLHFAALTAAASLTTVGHFRHAVEGAFVRNVWAAVGCANGMRSADWALCGIGGSPSTPYATYTELLGQPPQPTVLTAELGATWAITQGYHKIHGCCQSTHSAVEAMLLARDRLKRPDSYREIDRIELETHRPGMTNKAPKTTLAARFSFEHVVAAACVYGHAGVAAFSTEALSDPDVARLREHTDVRRFEPQLPRPNDRPARVTLHLKGGEKLTSECLSARGGPDQPLDEQVILDKVAHITAPVYPRFLETVRALAALDAKHLTARWRSTAGALTARD
jgi:2-methylcitrate dehydratase PrpD